VDKSVLELGLCCLENTDTSKGFTYISDAIKATKDILATPLGQKLKEKGVCYIRCLTDRDQPKYKLRKKGWSGVEEHGIYNHW